MIQRIFYPVGQGAFYSEKHENYNIVYDCGSMSISKGKKVVSQKFSKEDIIDILFISHFDYDHISLIEDLKATVREIRFVVIPLLHRNEKILLSNVFKTLEEDALVTLVNNPNRFFGAETRIISVQVYKEKEEEGINSEKEEEVANIELFNLIGIEQNQEIPSGTPITIDNDSDWVFIPFNYKYKDRNKEFLNNLKYDEIEKLKSSEHIFDSEFRNKIKTIYKKINGNINENSMSLYSGPYKKDSQHYKGLDWTFKHLKESSFNYFLNTPSLPLSKCSFFKRRKCHFLEDFLPCLYRVACLYTGDGDLNKADMEKIYKDYWNLIGTIQIPHHGSLKSFNKSILKDQYFLCPISVGKNNSYGHPSRVVFREILDHRSYPIFVTEDIDSEFTETIERINN
jgi:hypothetical protein